MSEKIGELLVQGLKRGEGAVTEPKSIQIKAGSMGESVSSLWGGEGASNKKGARGE